MYFPLTTLPPRAAAFRLCAALEPLNIGCVFANFGAAVEGSYKQCQTTRAELILKVLSTDFEQARTTFPSPQTRHLDVALINSEPHVIRAL